MVVRFFRLWLPIGLVIGGVVYALAAGADRAAFEVGTPLAAAGLVIFAVNFLVRLSIDEEKDRDRDEAQRQYFAEHGRWPDDPS